jgi:beta-xylosidase
MAAKQKIKNIFSVLGILAFSFCNTTAQTYTNPILHEDYSDPDAIRVGNEFYMVASSFNHTPGLPILKSSDLVHWQLIGHALKNNDPMDYYKKVQHGAGVWAPSIRFHQGKYYIYYPDPDFGIYQISAKQILGEWSKPVLVIPGKGLIDPCPLWDKNGKVYLVHAFAGSRAGIKSVLAIKELNQNGTKVIDEGKLIYDGHTIDPTIEGPKIYQRNGWYYIFAPAGGVSTGWQTVLRSKQIYGPYERKKVMDQGNTNINGPHQGAWVQTNTGEDWFLHFQDKGAYGRIVHLQPMQWKNDWPVIGEDKDGDGVGEPVATYHMPTMLKQRSQNFSKTNLKEVHPGKDLNYQWNANENVNWRFPLLDQFRFYAIPLLDSSKNLWNFPALYLRKLPAESFTVITQLKMNSLQVGERAGFILFGKSYASIELMHETNEMVLNYVECLNADKNNPEKKEIVLKNAPTLIYLKMQMSQGAMAQFSYSLNGLNYINLPHVFKAVPGVWVGAKMGFYCNSNKSTNDAGFMEINSVTIQK